MPGASSDYNLAAIYSTLPRWHPPRTGRLTTHHLTSLFFKLIWCLATNAMTGRPESVTGTARQLVLRAIARRRTKVTANIPTFSHDCSIAIVEYSRIQR